MATEENILDTGGEGINLELTPFVMDTERVAQQELEGNVEPSQGHLDSYTSDNHPSDETLNQTETVDEPFLQQNTDVIQEAGSSCEMNQMNENHSLADSSSFMPTESSGEMIKEAAQKLIEDINEKRKQDNELLSQFKDSIQVMVEGICQKVDQKIYYVYDKHNQPMQEKLADLFATVDRINKLEFELKQFKQALGCLYQDVN